jgi:hypothetical protein
LNNKEENQVVDIKEELLEEKEVKNENVKYINLESSKEENSDIFEMLPEEVITTDHTHVEEINLKEEDIIQGSTIEETQLEELLTDINMVKPEVVDYKKMSLTKLRSIILEKGLSDNNISKLKKNELLQILESNSHN